jgi:hypothetical protein
MAKKTEIIQGSKETETAPKGVRVKLGSTSNYGAVNIGGVTVTALNPVYISEADFDRLEGEYGLEKV